MDDEIKRELMDSFTDIYEEVEHCLVEIKSDADPELLNRLFRSIHNAKGNAGMMMLENIVAFTHAIEEVAGAVRAKRFPCTMAISEIIQISMDRLKDLHLRDLFAKSYDNLREAETINMLETLARCDAGKAEEVASKILNFLGEGVSEPGTIRHLPEAATASNDPVITITIDDEKLNADLLFFQEMALQIDSQTQYWEGRSIQLFDWAMKMNHLGGKPVSYEQLAAAVYMHDIGMSFIPMELINKKEAYTEMEWDMIHRHPRWGYDLLRRIPGWEEAATIILDHHEHMNGKGYPNSKMGEDIHVGARIIAILDAFFSITRGRADRDRRKTVIRAISEINTGIDTQFDATWVQCFNNMVRQELQSGML